MARIKLFSLESSEGTESELDIPGDLDDQITSAHAELLEHNDGIDTLLDQSDEAQDAVDTMRNVRDTLTNTDTISVEAMQLTQICINSLYKRLGVSTDSLISLEAASRNFALESVSEGIKKVIETLKKAVTYIWSKLVAFYKLVCVKILGLFKKKHAEVKTKADPIHAEAYDKAVAATKLAPFTDLGIFTAFAGKEREVSDYMVLIQMGHMESCVSKTQRHLNEVFKIYVNSLSKMLKDFKSASSDQERKSVVTVTASATKGLMERIFDAKKTTGKLFSYGLPYYEELANDDSGFPRFRHQRGNNVSRTQAFVISGNKRYLDEILVICGDITNNLLAVSKLIISNENEMSQFTADIDRNFSDEEANTGHTKAFLEEVSVSLIKVSKHVAYMNHEIITLATKSVREAYRYVELSTKAAEEASK